MSKKSVIAIVCAAVVSALLFTWISLNISHVHEMHAYLDTLWAVLRAEYPGLVFGGSTYRQDILILQAVRIATLLPLAGTLLYIAMRKKKTTDR